MCHSHFGALRPKHKLTGSLGLRSLRRNMAGSRDADNDLRRGLPVSVCPMMASGMQLPLPVRGEGSMVFGFETIIAAFLTGSVLSLVISQLFRLLSEVVDLERGDVPKLAVLGIMLLAGPHILAAAARKLGRLREYPWEYAAVIYLFSLIWAGVVGLAALTLLSWLWIMIS